LQINRNMCTFATVKHHVIRQRHENDEQYLVVAQLEILKVARYVAIMYCYSDKGARRNATSPFSFLSMSRFATKGRLRTTNKNNEI